MSGWRDRLAGLAARPGLPAAILAAAMPVSLLVCLYAGRGLTFSGDELQWIADAPGTGIGQAFDPHSGHLVLVSRLLYRFLVETVGAGYVTFRLLSLLAVFLTVGLLFIWARRRVGGWVALAPCLVLLFFGSDSAHIIQGNGFTVMLAIACGLLALVMVDRGGTASDLVAALALCLGVLTYTVALPFVAGVAALILAGPDRLRRSWVFLAPSGIYLAWWLWTRFSGSDLSGGEVDLLNILLLPAWSFQAIGAALSALSGLGFNFRGSSAVESGSALAPVLALIFLALLAWRYRSSVPGRALLGVAVIAAAMYALQVIAWIPGMRLPESSRYLYPGAIVVLLVAFEAARGWRPDHRALVALFLVATAGLATNLMLLRENGTESRARAASVEAEIAAVNLIGRMGPFTAGPSAQPLVSLVNSYSPAIAEIGEAADRYGLGIEPDRIAAEPEPVRAKIDGILTGALAPTLVQVDRGTALSGCRAAVSGNGGYAISLPAGGAAIVGKRDGKLGIGRFGEGFPAAAGTFKAERPSLLAIPDDGNEVAWKVSSEVPFVVCDLPRS